MKFYAPPLTLCALTLLLGLHGCSYKKIAYKYADWIIMRKVDAYFDLDAAQKELLAPRLDAQLQDFKTSLLPQLATTLTTVHEKSSDGLTNADLEWMMTRYQELRVAFFTAVSMDITALLATISPEQRAHFEKAIAESNEDYEDLLGQSDDELKATVFAKRLDQLEDFFGDFSREQEARLREIVGEDRQRVANRFAVRQAFQQAVIALVRGPADAAARRTQISKWARHPEQMLAPPMAEKYADNWRRYRQAMLQIDQLLTTKQRQHFLEKVASTVADLKEISG